MDLVHSDPSKKRKCHLNRMLSKHIGTRSPVQCRSHHQQMLKVHENIDNIVQRLLNMDTKVKENNSETLESRE